MKRNIVGMTKLTALVVFSVLFLVACTHSSKNPELAIDEKEFVPQWAKTVVWYQIFPERFRDGDSSNNPTMSDIVGADPQEPPKSWQIHPWGSDWYKLLAYEKRNGEPEMWKHLLRRRYGGDIQGIIDKLDYLQGLRDYSYLPKSCFSIPLIT